jgi:hypothetical protein
MLFIDEMLPDPRLGAGFPRAAEMINAITAAGWQVAHFAKKSSSAHRAEMQRKFGEDVEFLAGQGKHGLIRVLREQGDSFAAIVISRPTTMMTFLNALQSRGCDKPLPYIFYDAEAIFIDREIARSELNGRAMSEDERDRGVEAEISLTSILSQRRLDFLVSRGSCPASTPTSWHSCAVDYRWEYKCGVTRPTS